MVARSLWDLLGFTGSPDSLLHGIALPGSGSGRRSSGGKKAARVAVGPGGAAAGAGAEAEVTPGGRAVLSLVGGVEVPARVLFGEVEEVGREESRRGEEGSVVATAGVRGSESPMCGVVHSLVLMGEGKGDGEGDTKHGAGDRTSGTMELSSSSSSSSSSADGQKAAKQVIMSPESAALCFSTAVATAAADRCRTPPPPHLSLSATQPASDGGSSSGGVPPCAGGGNAEQSIGTGQTDVKRRRRLRIFQEMTVA